MMVDLPAEFGSSGIIRFEISRQKAKWGLKTSNIPRNQKSQKRESGFSTIPARRYLQNFVAVR